MTRAYADLAAENAFLQKELAEAHANIEKLTTELDGLRAEVKTWRAVLYKIAVALEGESDRLLEEARALAAEAGVEP